MKKALPISTMIISIIALLTTSLLPAQAAVLRIPKQAFPACSDVNGIYCIEAITITGPQGKIIPLQWVQSGKATPMQPSNGGISYAPVAKVINSIVKDNSWWTTQYIRDALVSGTTDYLDISPIIGTASYPEIGAYYNSNSKSFDITKPVEYFSTQTSCWDSKTNTSSHKTVLDCYKGSVAAIHDGEVKFILEYSAANLALEAVKELETTTWVDLKPLATQFLQPTINSRYNTTTKLFTATEKLQTPVWVTNNSLLNGWDVLGSQPTLNTQSITTDTLSSGSSQITTDPANNQDKQTTTPAPLTPNENTVLLAPSQIGRNLTGRWTSPLWNTLGLGSLGYDGLFIDAKSANGFVNQLFVDVQPVLTTGDSKSHLAAQIQNADYAVSLDADIIVKIKLRVGDLKPAATLSVGVDTTLNTQANKDYTTITLEGAAVNVALAKSPSDCATETGIAKANIRQLQTLLIAENDFSGFGTGSTSGNIFVASNGVCSLTTPTWNPSEKSFSWTTAAPHFAPDGKTVNTGFYKAVIPFQDAAILWGLTNPADAQTALDISITTDLGGTSTAISTISAKNGNIIIDVSGFSYSKPTIKIKMRKGYKPSQKTISSIPAPKYTITCALGATTKHIRGTNPKCSKSYNKVGSRK